MMAVGTVRYINVKIKRTVIGKAAQQLFKTFDVEVTYSFRPEVGVIYAICPAGQINAYIRQRILHWHRAVPVSCYTFFVA